ncbi:flavin monoamine oxidase family protein [Psychroserpens jangbogonensis]|uniref:flavin monoamine oxidase family protein n=1 Tax=Psychroserpens jangbogonensis TaxID=1484460 RepID=UPI00053E6343|nr:NAD(P)/FAD-dependent oxidoreductase [Psychroserpens jangbogonensis]
MQNKHTDILIIGAGLTGLTLAHYLKQLNLSVTIVESRNRIGGRIYTKYNESQAPVELGATWLTNEHSELLKLLKALKLDVFDQHYGNTAIYEPDKTNPPQLVNLPNNNHSSFRINKGTQSIIEAIANGLEDSQIITNCTIKSIQKNEDSSIVKSNNLEFQCKRVISTLPPFLFKKTINIEPILPIELIDVMNKTHTWMGESIKVGFTFKTPFWKEKRTSGTIYSNVSPLQEFYDHSSSDGTQHALVGFMNNSFHSNSKEERLKLALNQLQSYYGDQVLDFLSYEELVWKDENYTATEYDDYIMPQYNNGHPLYQNSYLDNTLFIAGTETSPYASGKMEGAIRSAQHIFKQIENLL